VIDLFAPAPHDLGKALDVFTRRLNPSKVKTDARARG
jgi:hypothetical protein